MAIGTSTGILNGPGEHRADCMKHFLGTEGNRVRATRHTAVEFLWWPRDEYPSTALFSRQRTGRLKTFSDGRSATRLASENEGENSSQRSFARLLLCIQYDSCGSGWAIARPSPGKPSSQPPPISSPIPHGIAAMPRGCPELPSQPGNPGWPQAGKYLSLSIRTLMFHPGITLREPSVLR
jgi:hypothetical protein